MHFAKTFALALCLAAPALARPLPQDAAATGTIAIATGANESVATQSDPTIAAVDNGPPPSLQEVVAIAPPAAAVVSAAETGGDDSIPSRSD
ncbi:hypothetical protein HDU89_003086 [Geranomyces variabilis]|nr:hypothetical protein HDU89_003086 [Geranomyces variabilis]